MTAEIVGFWLLGTSLTFLLGCLMGFREPLGTHLLCWPVVLLACLLIITIEILESKP